MTRFNKMVKNVSGAFTHAGQVFSAAKYAPTRNQTRNGLFILGVALIAMGVSSDAMAVGVYNGDRIQDSINLLLTHLEGAFGALVMVCAGLGAILSAAFGQYRAALGCLVVAVGAFILRSFLSTFFNVEIVDS
jgi:hypothetical protein